MIKRSATKICSREERQMMKISVHGDICTAKKRVLHKQRSLHVPLGEVLNITPRGLK